MQMLSQQALGLAWLLNEHKGADVTILGPPNSHWLHADFPTIGLKFCVWDTTGSVYRVVENMGLDMVEDDPIFTPGEYEFAVMLKQEKVAQFAERMMTERDDALARVEELQEELESIRDYAAEVNEGE